MLLIALRTKAILQSKRTIEGDADFSVIGKTSGCQDAGVKILQPGMGGFI